MSKYRKILLILVFISIVIAIGYFLYFLFFKPAVSPITPPDEEAGILPTLPIAMPGEPIIIEPEIPVELPQVVKPPTVRVDTRARGGITEITDFSNHSTMDPYLDK